MVRMNRRNFALATAGTVALFPMARAFAQDVVADYATPENAADLSGAFSAAGSSTLGPLTEAAIESFAEVAPNVQITNSITGSGGGFERLGNGEVAFSNASRAINQEEADAAAANGIKWYRFDMALDGITVVVAKENDFCTDLTVEELAHIWRAEDPAMTWADVRPEWPAETIALYGPGTTDGTYGYFTEEVLGEEAPRNDFSQSENDNVLVTGVAGSKYALGYFGFTYYEANQDKLNAVSVNGVLPSMDTISNGTYTPLGRTLYIYVNADELANRPEVQEFVKYYAASSGEIAVRPNVGYIPLAAEAQQATYDKVLGAIDGTVTPDSETFGQATPAATPAS